MSLLGLVKVGLFSFAVITCIQSVSFLACLSSSVVFLYDYSFRNQKMRTRLTEIFRCRRYSGNVFSQSRIQIQTLYSQGESIVVISKKDKDVTISSSLESLFSSSEGIGRHDIAAAVLCYVVARRSTASSLSSLSLSST